VRADGRNAVVYRAKSNGHIAELSWAQGEPTWVSSDILPGITVTPLEDVAPYTRGDGVDVVVYRGSAGIIYEVARTGGTWSWTGPYNLTNVTQAPAAAALPTGYVRDDGTSTVVFRASSTNHIWEMALQNGVWLLAHDLTPNGS
jgi:hypothetical protein